MIEFTLKGLPKMTNNNYTSWKAKMAEARKWKLKVYEKIYELKAKPPVPYEKVKLTLIRVSSIEPDYDGMVSGFKHIIDGLREAGVIANDKISNIGQPDYRHEKTGPKNGHIKVKVEPL